MNERSLSDRRHRGVTDGERRESKEHDGRKEGRVCNSFTKSRQGPER